MSDDTISVAEILGPWVEPSFDSGLIARCRSAWNKPLRDLSREELATLLRQRGGCRREEDDGCEKCALHDLLPS